ncbi:MAG: AAA family ATPase [Clostridiales bacterium]|nr:AAA family ATPase [Clostridiales bacterium]
MKYGLIGEKLSHSYSVEIHNLFGNGDYILKEIPVHELDDFFAKKDFQGINVTIPYKEKVMKYLDYIDDAAKEIGCVNTVIKKDGKLFGYNTDFYGLKGLLSKNSISLSGKTVAILGTGGTSKTAYVVSKSENAEKIFIVSRSPKSDNVISYDKLYEIAENIDVIINTTPSGMYPNDDDKVISLDSFSKLSALIDVIYHPLRTNLVTEAKQKGIVSEGGLYMLVSQAQKAEELFFDGKTQNDIESVYQQILRAKQNIVLIGMPGSGKTTVGRLLSEKLDMDFVDADYEFINKFGISISNYFQNHSEDEFRDEEEIIVSDISKKTSTVISTGGGVIIRENNIKKLRRNGIIVFLDRPLEELTATKGRPLTPDLESIKKKYEERFEKYKKAADYTVYVDSTATDAANKITDVLGYNK